MGRQPELGAGPLQETHSTGYANDLPLRDYDFQAPIGAAGDVREHAQLLRLLHGGVTALTELFATGVTTFPPPRQVNLLDANTFRYSIRTAGNQAVVVFNNHQPDTAMAEQPDVQLRAALPGGEVLVPPEPVTVRGGDYGFWPAGIDLGGGAVLRSANVQPIGRCRVDGVQVWAFRQVVDGDAVLDLTHSAGAARRLRLALTGADPVVSRIATEQGPDIMLMVANREQAPNLFLTGAGPILTDAMVRPVAAAQDDAEGNDPEDAGRFAQQLEVLAARPSEIRRWTPDGGWTAGRTVGAAAGPRALNTVRVQQGTRPSFEFGRLAEGERTASGDEVGAGGRPSAPGGAAFADAAGWRVELPPLDERGPDDWCEVHWEGDVVRVAVSDPTIDADVVADQFWSPGRPLRIAAADLAAASSVVVAILARPENLSPLAPGQGDEATLLSVRWVTVQTARLPLPA
ncbi:hypothetical protein [Nakamurella aerolata]|uniref:hypothetical protein n=1 Tax=Nakamurella aerolata TaxID=1656892 RepID=UPI001FE5C122|nr:hypothetical protein [Nakamurella aerolata]